MLNQEKFREDYGIHGMKHVFDTSNHKIVRIFWIFAVLLSICGFLVYLKNAWFKLMYEPEVVIATHDRSAKEFPYPAITICPKVFTSRKIVHLTDLDDQRRNFTDEKCKILLGNVLWLHPNVVKFVFENVCPDVKNLDFNIVQTIQNSSISPKELFRFDERLTQKTAFSGFGPCYTLNGLSFSKLFKAEIIHEDFKQFTKFFIDSKSGYKKTRTIYEDNSTWSPEMGLQIGSGFNLRSDLTRLSSKPLNILLTLSPEHTKNLNQDAYFRMFIHKPNEIVTNLHVDYAISYNESRRFRLKVKSRKTDDALRLFPPESRKCYFENEKPLKFFKSYTKLNCEWECRTNDMLRDCKCVLYNMPRDSQTKVCNIFESVGCIPNKTECDCYAPCNDLTFELTSETLRFDVALFSIMEIEDWTNWNGDFLADDSVEETETYSSYKTENFIAEFGGFLGLFMGCSLLSIVEIIFFFLLAIRSTLIKIFCNFNRPIPMESISSVIEVIPADSHEKNDRIVEALNILRRTIKEMQEQIGRQCEINLKMEARLANLEKKVSENLIFDDF